MRERPIRPHIYKPVVLKLGIFDRDLKWVVAAGTAGYVVPFTLKLPYTMPSCLVAVGLAVLFFNFVRKGRPPFWLHHVFQDLKKSRVVRKWLPVTNKTTQWVLYKEGKYHE